MHCQISSGGALRIIIEAGEGHAKGRRPRREEGPYNLRGPPTDEHGLDEAGQRASLSESVSLFSLYADICYDVLLSFLR